MEALCNCCIGGSVLELKKKSISYVLTSDEVRSPIAQCFCSTPHHGGQHNASLADLGSHTPCSSDGGASLHLSDEVEEDEQHPEVDDEHVEGEGDADVGGPTQQQPRHRS